MTLALFLVLMAGFTLIPPVAGGTAVPFMLGEGPLWLTFFTHPWVHQSGYHLVLDGGAFLGLWGMLEGGTRRRWTMLGWANLGSVLAVGVTGLQGAGGFGGLSGIAHGLMAVVAVDWIRDRNSGLSTAGIWILAGVLGKGLMELWTGTPLFSGLHLGDIGTPLVACHLGGTLGALVGCGVERVGRRHREPETPNACPPAFRTNGAA